jgi:hypothetical protein
MYGTNNIKFPGLYIFDKPTNVYNADESWFPLKKIS